nr:FMN-binding protein [uncultured Anaerobutyricum sp.]
MKYKNFLIRLFDLILVLGLLAGYQAVIYSRDKEAQIIELESQVNQLQGEKKEILEAAKSSGKFGTDGNSTGTGGAYKDGTYTGSAQGFGGEIKVKVTVSGQKISAIDITEASGEDEAYLSMAKDIINTMVDQQTVDVDTVSGATYSSTGIKNAVTQALEGAAQ